MDFLREVLAGIRRLDDEPQDDTDELDLDAEQDDPEGEIDLDDLSDLGLDDLEGDLADELPEDPDASEADYDGADLSGGPMGSSTGETGDLTDPTGDEVEMDGVADQATENPDRRGLIRTVKNAHLVYKRETEEGTFEELWVYNITSMRDEQTTKRAILAGTDIPANKVNSPDGSQTYEIWASGNAELLRITGLPN